MQLKTRDGQWMDARAPVDTVLVVAGDLLEVRKLAFVFLLLH